MNRLLQLIILVFILTFAYSCKTSEVEYSDGEKAFIEALNMPISSFDTELIEQSETTVKAYFTGLLKTFKDEGFDAKLTFDEVLETKKLPLKGNIGFIRQKVFKGMAVGDIMMYSCNTLGLKWTVYPDRKEIHIEETREEKIRRTFFKEFNEKTIRWDSDQKLTHISELPEFLEQLEKQFAEKGFEVEFVLDDLIKNNTVVKQQKKEQKKTQDKSSGMIYQRYYEVTLKQRLDYLCSVAALRYDVDTEKKEIRIGLDYVYEVTPEHFEDDFVEDDFNDHDKFAEGEFSNDEFLDDDFDEE